MFKNRILGIVAVLVFSLLIVSGTSAQEPTSDPYIQINNGTISITPTERPQIVLQFGNRGQATAENIGILCVALGELRISNGFTYNAFPSLSIAPDLPGVALPNQAISYPSAFSYLGLADEFIDIRSGQNFNVAFRLEIEQDDDAETNGGDVLCALVDGSEVAAAAGEIGLGPANLTDEAVINLVASVALDLASVSVVLR
ncbi:MAG: hypothetical protein AAFV93_05210 [Chloroflexota bacterium]